MFDFLAHVARPARDVRRDSAHRYVELAAAQLARDEAAAVVLAQVRCPACTGSGHVDENTHECPACAGSGLDPDITYNDLLPADRPAAGTFAARAVDTERARLRRVLSTWHDRIDPPTSDADANFAMALRVVIGEIDDDRHDRDAEALTADDLHELADYAELAAAMYEASDHRDPAGQPTPGDLGESARLRALAARARQHLGSPTGHTPAVGVPVP